LCLFCHESRAIPTRTVLINDTTQLPHDYCTTPGGTLFSTTPGGTRIIYDRKFLLDRRNSPIAQTPQPTCQSSKWKDLLSRAKKDKALLKNPSTGGGPLPKALPYSDIIIDAFVGLNGVDSTASVAAERDEELEDECDVVTGTCGGPRSFIA
uniref:Eukaryotic translation initiation factor 4E binding protein 2 n=1 Tax=Neogobius melanostomus TaxID=47308 RepID=A0A8C6UZF6_9GOBI